MDAALDNMTKTYNQNKVPIGPIIKETFLVSWQKKNEIIRATLIPLIVVTLMTVFNLLYIDDKGSLSGIAYSMLSGIPNAILAITCHRIILLNENSMQLYSRPLWTQRETRFYIYWLIISLIDFPVSREVLFNPFYVFIVFPLAIYITARLSVVFPAIAIDKKIGFSWSWKVTKGNGFRIIIISSAISLVIVSALLATIAPVLLIYEKNNLSKALISVAFSPLFMILIVELSLIYKYLMKTN